MDIEEPFFGEGDGDGAGLAEDRAEKGTDAKGRTVGIEVELVVRVGIATIEAGVEGDGDCLGV